MKNKVIKRIIIVFAVVFIMIIVAGLLIGNYFYNVALNPAGDNSAVLAAPHNSIGSTDDTAADDWESKIEANKNWLIEVNAGDIYMQSYDGLNLHASQITAKEKSNLWVILCHGYNSQGSSMVSSARTFYEMGYHLLLPDARGAGESEGSYTGMGWNDRLDVVGWIDEIIRQDSDAQIVLYGVSMGGATVMMVSGEDLPENVKAIVEDCGYSSVWDEFSYQLKEVFHLPAFPIMHFASLVTRVRAGFWLGEADAVAQVAKSKTPILFIHGDTDTFVPFSMLQEVYDATDVEKEMLIAKGAGHGMAASVLDDAYWETVESFINRYLE